MLTVNSNATQGTYYESVWKDFLVGVITLNEALEALRFQKVSAEVGDVRVVSKNHHVIHKDDMHKLTLLRGIDPEVIEQLVRKLRNDAE